MIYMFLSNIPSAGDINSSNLPCLGLFLNKRLKDLDSEKQEIFNYYS